MKKSYPLLAATLFATSLWGSSYGDSLSRLLYQAARTNATIFVSQQAAANTNNLTGTILQSSLDANFDGQGTVSNTLTRILGLNATGNTKTQATATSTSSNTSATATSQKRPNRRHGHRPPSHRHPANGYYPR